MKSILSFSIIGLSLILSLNGLAQTNQLDPTFGNNGKVITQLSQPDKIIGLAEQSDGKILALGEHHLVRYNRNGSLDNSFGVNGVVDSMGLSGRCIKVLPNGEILVAGADSLVPYPTEARMAKFLTDGQPDTSFGQYGMVVFGVGTGSTEEFFDIAVQGDGKILASGYSAWGGPMGQPGSFGLLVRYNPDGSPDTTFSCFVGNTIKILLDIHFISNNQAMVGGIDRGGNSSAYKSARVNLADGTVDSTYGANGLATSSVIGGYAYPNSLSIQAAFYDDGHAYIQSNRFGNYFWTRIYQISGITPNGNQDTAFAYIQEDSTFSKVMDAGAIAVLNSSSLFSAGTLFGDLMLLHFNENAKIDSTIFPPMQIDFGGNDAAHALIMDKYDNLVIAGKMDSAFALARILPSVLSQRDFVTTWKTDNPGTLSNDSSIYIWAEDPNFVYNYDVDWDNDGIFDTIGVTGSITHLYPSPGTYTIRIRGDFPKVYFGGSNSLPGCWLCWGGGDHKKLMAVNQWGSIYFKELKRAFENCENMNVLASDAPKLDSLNGLGLNRMFQECTSLNANLNHWDVSNVSSMFAMFHSASSFNQPLDQWDVSNTMVLEHMFYQATSFDQNLGSWNINPGARVFNFLDYSGLSVANYDSTLIGWDDQKLARTVPIYTSFAIGLKYCQGKIARDSLIANGWSFFGDTYDCSFLNDFVTTWKTDNPGTFSNDSSIYIWAEDTNFVYNYDVDWDNDGIFDTIGVTGSITHQYPSPGTYTIRIRGDFPKVYFGGSNPTPGCWICGFDGDHKKLMAVNQWGSIYFKELEKAFEGCQNMNVLASDAPKLDSLNGLGLNRMFQECTSLNANLNHWDVSNVSSMFAMFHSASSFNQPLDQWDVSNTMVLEHMFYQATSFDQNLGSWNINPGADVNNFLDYSGLSVANYDSTLIGWDNQKLARTWPIFGGFAFGLKYCQGKIARDSLIANGWSISGDTYDCSSVNDFVTTWQVGLFNLGNAADSMVIIPINSNFNYNYNVDWDNDGIFDTLFVTGPISHKYNSQGLKTIRISGDFPALAFNSLQNGFGLISIDQWGNQIWKSMENGLYNCYDLQSVGPDAPILDSVTSLAGLFGGDANFNSDISSWDVSHITNLAGMFLGAKVFNQDLSSWDVSNVTNMALMFFDADSFNQNITGWDVSSVVDMNAMFAEADGFNQNIGSWDVSNVESMGAMFSNASLFDQNLGSWDISSIVNSKSGPLGWPIAGLGYIFVGSNMSINSYDRTLIGWQSKNHPNNLDLISTGLLYCQAKNARDSLLADGWNITGDSLACNGFDHFVTTWKTDNWGTLSNDSAIYIKATNFGSLYPFKYDVDWDNDGIFDTLGVTTSVSHQYASPGTYTIRIRGDFPRIEFGGSSSQGDHKKLISVDQWGTIPYKGLFAAFSNCENMNVRATDAPNLDSLNSVGLFLMFQNCTSLNSNINHWDVSNVKVLSQMFQGASNFNQPLNQWDVSASTGFTQMFFQASSFDQNIGSWTFAKNATFLNMLTNSGMSVQSYDSTLIGWANHTQPDSIFIHSGVYGLKYCAGKYSRDSLIARHWTFWGDTLDCSPTCLPTSGSMTASSCDSYISPSGNHIWSQSGVYQDTLVNVAGCDSILTISLLVTSVDTNVTQSGITLTSNASNATYQWLDCGTMQPISGANQQSYLATANGKYAVIVTENGCTDTSACYAINNIGLNERGNTGFLLYPNPSSGIITLDFKNSTFSGNLKIFSISGQKVIEKDLKNEQRVVLNLGLSKGVYILSLSSESHQTNRRIVIE